jgi:ankyrin repeat protein
VLRLLIAGGASAALADDRGFTPLHCVAGHGFYAESIEMAEILVQAGADVNARSTQLGFVPLHEARTTRMVDWLLVHGADPMVRNDEGQTPEEYLRARGQPTEANRLRYWAQRRPVR